MFKKAITAITITGVLFGGILAYACSDYSNGVYEYLSKNNGTHDVGFTCNNQYCDDPYTVFGNEKCDYETVNIEEENTWLWYAVTRCKDCGYELSRVNIG